MPIRPRECLACGHRYDVLEVAGTVATIDLPEGDERDVCPACESAEHRSLVPVVHHTDSDSRWYNRTIPGLGYVQDKTHHDRLCREKGIQRSDWSSVQREASRRKTRREQATNALNDDHQRRLATDVEYRKAVDEGATQQRLKGASFTTSAST